MINFEPLTILAHMGLFLVMVIFLNSMLFKPMLKIMEEREKKIGGNKKLAEESECRAEEIISEYEAKIADAKKEANKERDKVRSAAEAEEDKMIKAAREKAGDMIADLREKISVEYKEAEGLLQAQSREMGKEVAQKILGRAV